ncbi:tachylectin-related carbohydrate-binding protein, partial [Streptomyces sp. NPDC001581]|uniref:tachylectin-related carbohydrate-binding protein n=1 Tax=Streptomyces sp. NPDC001581 TaxID=3154386 RepID=UPI0033315062
MAEGGILAIIYGITPDGDLQWYRHSGWEDGTNRWTTGEGGEYVSGGWNIYRTVFCGAGGVIYGITPGGDLQWYRHDGVKDGSNRWTAGAGGKNVSGGWDIYSIVLSDTVYLVGDLSAATIPTVEHVPVGKLDPNAPGVITYQRKTFDANGVLRVKEGLVAAGTPVPVGPLHVP